MRPPVIVNVAIGHNYPIGQDRLHRSLAKYSDPKVSFLGWCNEYPKGCPTHQEVPYAFKAYAIKAAKDAGYKKILWMDASAWLNDSWGDFWECFNSRPMMIWNANVDSMGIWCADSALTLLGVTREESFNIPMCEGLICGFNFNYSETHEIWDYYWEQANNGAFKGFWFRRDGFVSDNPKVLGHRHDMPALSVACNRLNIDIIDTPKYFDRVNDDYQPSQACIYARGL